MVTLLTFLLIIVFGTAALCLLLAITNAKKLFTILAKSHRKYYDSIGKPLVISSQNPEAVNPRTIAGATFIFNTIPGKVPTGFPASKQVRFLLQKITEFLRIFITMFVIFACLVITLALQKHQ